MSGWQDYEIKISSIAKNAAREPYWGMLKNNQLFEVVQQLGFMSVTPPQGYDMETVKRVCASKIHNAWKEIDIHWFTIEEIEAALG